METMPKADRTIFMFICRA